MDKQQAMNMLKLIADLYGILNKPTQPIVEVSEDAVRTEDQE